MLRAPSLILPVLALALWPIQGRAQEGPSFNCRYAGTETERAICASPELSLLERQMYQSYLRLVDAVGERQARRIADSFLERRQACGASEVCIATRLLISMRVFERRAGGDVEIAGREPTESELSGLEEDIAAAPEAAPAEEEVASAAPRLPDSVPLPRAREDLAREEVASAEPASPDLPLAAQAPFPEDLDRLPEGEAAVPEPGFEDEDVAAVEPTASDLSAAIEDALSEGLDSLPDDGDDAPSPAADAIADEPVPGDVEIAAAEPAPADEDIAPGPAEVIVTAEPGLPAEDVAAAQPDLPAVDVASAAPDLDAVDLPPVDLPQKDIASTKSDLAPAEEEVAALELPVKDIASGKFASAPAEEEVAAPEPALPDEEIAAGPVPSDPPLVVADLAPAIEDAAAPQAEPAAEVASAELAPPAEEIASLDLPRSDPPFAPEEPPASDLAPLPETEQAALAPEVLAPAEPPRSDDLQAPQEPAADLAPPPETAPADVAAQFEPEPEPTGAETVASAEPEPTPPPPADQLEASIAGAELASSDEAAPFDQPISWAFMDLLRTRRAEVQSRLQAAGYYEGSTEGSWNRATLDAFEAFFASSEGQAFDPSTERGAALAIDYIRSDEFSGADAGEAAEAGTGANNPLASTQW